MAVLFVSKKIDLFLKFFVLSRCVFVAFFLLTFVDYSAIIYLCCVAQRIYMLTALIKEDSMINTRRLRGKIVEKGMTYEGVADMMGISSCTFGRKMRKVSDMTLSEAELLVDILDIRRTELADIFFTEEDVF